MMDNNAPPPYTGTAAFPADKKPAAPPPSAPLPALPTLPALTPPLSLLSPPAPAQTTLTLSPHAGSLSGGDFTITENGAPVLHARGSALALKGRTVLADPAGRELCVVAAQKARQLLRPAFVASGNGHELTLRSLHAWGSTEMAVEAAGRTLALRGAPDAARLMDGAQVVADIARVPCAGSWLGAHKVGRQGAELRQYLLTVAPGADVVLVVVVGICFHTVTGGMA